MPWRTFGRRTRSRRRPHVRRRVAIGALAVCLVGGGWLWVRDSPLVAADDVTITGLTGPDAPAIRSALEDAAGDMTTLHVRKDRLRTAVSPYPVVKDLRVETHFPHEMVIKVIEHDAVAAVDIDGRRVPVAADGTLLRGRPAGAQLVTLSIPPANGGGRLTSARGRAAVAVMGAADKRLRPYVTGIEFGPDGLRITLRNGPLLQFGDATRARAKWFAAARVLADPRVFGASYVDLRAPARPVAGRFEDPTSAPALDGQAPPTAGQAAEEEGTENAESDGAAQAQAQAGVETDETIEP
jgi:cell division protein FtsQ